LENVWAGASLAGGAVAGPMDSVQLLLQKRIKKLKSDLAQCDLEGEALGKKITIVENLLKLLAALSLQGLPKNEGIASLRVEILKRKTPAKLEKLYLEKTALTLRIASLNAEISSAEAMLAMG
jgi:hypothetical protein